MPNEGADAIQSGGCAQRCLQMQQPWQGGHLRSAHHWMAEKVGECSMCSDKLASPEGGEGESRSFQEGDSLLGWPFSKSQSTISGSTWLSVDRMDP